MFYLNKNSLSLDFEQLVGKLSAIFFFNLNRKFPFHIQEFLNGNENKFPDILAEFKKGNLPEDGLKKMTELVASLVPQYK